MDQGTAAGWDSPLPHAPHGLPAHSDESRFAVTVSEPSARTLRVRAPSAAELPAGGNTVFLQPTPLAPPRRAVAHTPSAPSRPESDSPPSSRRFAHLPGLSLMVIILTAQGALSASFLRANTATGDEAMYLWAGRLEWAHWLHGTSIPDLPTWFSGSPLCYPPLAAIASDLGGLTGARVLSLCFMLGATSLLWGTTFRLFGRRPAFFAAALFAVIAPTLHVGAFATSDAMVLFLLALAAFCACGARTKQDATGWILACAGALTLANATQYASAIFDPVVVIMAVLSACPRPGGKAALRRASLLVTSLTGALALLLKLGGPRYITGVTQSTVLPPDGGVPMATVLTQTWEWTAVILVAALAGLAVSLIRRAPRPVSGLIAVLAAAALLVPLDQARIHAVSTLGKQLDLGAWFACIAGGYALGLVATWLRPRFAHVIVTICLGAAIVPVAAAGLSQAQSTVSWPDTGRLTAFLRPLTRHGARILAETAGVPDTYLQYYLPGTSWRQWSSTFSITMPDGHVVNADGKPGLYKRAIENHYFSLVILSFSATPGIDRAITGALKGDPDYQYVGTVPYSGPATGNYVIWQYRPPARLGGP